jgi:hypothetical protein
MLSPRLMADGPGEFWNGPPERLPDGFRMTKPNADRAMTATCEVWTNPFGWELRLMIEDRGMPMTSVVRSAAEMVALVETWRAALLEAGWIAATFTTT